MIKRIKLWWRVRKRRHGWGYNDKTGEGLHVDHYNPLTNVVTFHYSKFGTSDWPPSPWYLKLDEFERLRRNYEWRR